MAGAVYWIGGDGNAYLKSVNGVQKYTNPTGAQDAGFSGLLNGIQGQTVQATRIADPNPQRQVDYSQNTGGSSAAAPDTTADDLAFLADQEAQLRSLLGRTDTGLNQGLTKLEDDYNTETGYQNAQKDRAIQGYGDQRVDVNKTKSSTLGTINKNAGNGYRSLAQIIGRASGTGSSAYQQLLPDVVGKDISGKRKLALENAGTNLQKIDKKAIKMFLEKELEKYAHNDLNGKK